MAVRDPVLKLSDKTVALIGNFGSMIHMTMTVLTEQGANVALIGNESAEARRVIESLNDRRELYSHFGRATQIVSSLTSENMIQEAILRVVESFNRLDCLLDTGLCEGRNPTTLQKTAEIALKFLTSRPKGRLIIFYYDKNINQTLENWPTTDEINQLKENLIHLAKDNQSKLLNCNCLELGLTEEFLLRKYPKAPSIRMAFEAFQKEHSDYRLLEPIDIAHCAMLLTSPLSQAISGQTFSIS